MILAMCSLLEKGFCKRFLCFLPCFFSVGNRVFNLFAPKIGVSTGSADDFEVFPAAFSLWIWVLKRNNVRRKYYHDVMSPTKRGNSQSTMLLYQYTSKCQQFSMLYSKMTKLIPNQHQPHGVTSTQQK